jgi:hypothetical protein
MRENERECSLELATTTKDFAKLLEENKRKDGVWPEPKKVGREALP